MDRELQQRYDTNIIPPEYDNHSPGGSSCDQSYDDADGAAGMSRRNSTSSSDRSYDDDEEEEGGEEKYSYFAAATAAAVRSPGPSNGEASQTKNLFASPKEPDAYQDGLLIPTEDLLDIPVDSNERKISSEPAKGVLSFTNNFSHSANRNEEETIDFGDSDYVTTSLSRNSNKEYYDVLAMATDRLNNGKHPIVASKEKMAFEEGTGRERKQKNKPQQSGSKIHRIEREQASAEQAGQTSSRRSKEEESRRAVVMKSFARNAGKMKAPSTPKSPATPMSDYDYEYPSQNNISSGSLEMTERRDTNFTIDDEDENDDDSRENEALTSQRHGLWRPAALVNAYRSKTVDGRTDKHGFYALKGLLGTKKGPKSGTDSTYEELQRQNLAIKRNDSIIWADESITDRDGDGIEMVDDCSYDINNLDSHYKANNEFVVKMLKKQRQRRVYLMITAMILFLILCFVLTLTGDRVEEQPRGAVNEEGDSYFNNLSPPVHNDPYEKKDPVSRPLPPPPNPIDGLDENSLWVNQDSSLHGITLTDLQFIVEKITPDDSLLANPNTPQSKAMEWCKSDMTSYNVEVAARVAQRYVLATLYYSTSGDEWLNSTGWKVGHECTWHGVGCETGSDNVISVTYLDLSENHLEGTIPPEIGYISSLNQMHLWGNKLFGLIPTTLSRLVNLHTLYLDKNQLSGGIQGSVDSLKKLKHLDLSENKFKGKIPHSIGGLSSLADLRLSKNHFTGAFPISLTSIRNLQTLLLDNNAIGGSLPPLVGKMNSLVTLRLHENDFIGNLPSFSEATSLQEAHLDQNDFSGPIPDFGSNQLRELYLGRNSLSGSIPNSISELTSLEVFNVRANHLNGTIPPSISKAAALKILTLSYNKFSGAVPEELEFLIQLRELRLNDNRLRGPLPDFLGSLERLEVARLNNNLFSGPIKFSLEVGDLGYLREFTIHNNGLTGIIPEFVCDLLLDVLTSDCWGSPSPVDCPCCTDCF